MPRIFHARSVAQFLLHNLFLLLRYNNRGGPCQKVFWDNCLLSGLLIVAEKFRWPKIGIPWHISIIGSLSADGDHLERDEFNAWKILAIQSHASGCTETAVRLYCGEMR